MKSCDNCYWKCTYGDWCSFLAKKPTKNICGKYEYSCEECHSEIANYSYKSKNYCLGCMLEELEVESYEVTHYVLNGEYIGSEENIGEDILDVDENIKLLEE